MVSAESNRASPHTHRMKEDGLNCLDTARTNLASAVALLSWRRSKPQDNGAGLTAHGVGVCVCACCSIEGEVGLVVKGAKDGLDALQERIAEFSRQRGREAPSPHAVAHLQGVVLILSERLQQLTRLFDRCRAACFREALAPWEHANRLRVRAAAAPMGLMLLRDKKRAPPNRPSNWVQSGGQRLYHLERCNLPQVS